MEPLWSHLIFCWGSRRQFGAKWHQNWCHLEPPHLFPVGEAIYQGVFEKTSKNSVWPLHLFPLKSPNRTPILRNNFSRTRKSPLRNWPERAVSVCINTLFPRGNFYLLEDGSFTRHPCAQFEHMELWAHSLMIYYFQREIFTLWEATSSDYFPRGQIDHLELPIVIGSNWPNNTGHMLQSGKWANCPLTKKPSKQ